MSERGTSDKCKPIQAPVNTQVNCISASDSSPFYHCIANADPGYQFRDGDRSKQKDCDSMTGNFFGGNQFEPVVPICDPPCQHRGTCVMPDTCACTPGWKGAKCEQAAALCADPSSPQGGSIQCHQGTTKKECTVTCQPGFTFEYQPSDKYTCSSNGTWTPAVTSIPNCLPNHPHTTRDAMCAAWGQDHYRTFDGTVYSFQGHCEYLMAKDSKSDTFHIHLINDKQCTSHTPCKREIDVYIGQTVVRFRKGASGPIVYFNNFPLTIPTSRDGNTFEKLGHYIVMKSPLGFMIRWDGRQSVFLSVSADHKGGISGLCGTYNGNKGDDFTTDTGSVVKSPSSFASTWKKSAIGAAVCPDAPQKSCSGMQATQAESVCNKIMDPAFQACHTKVDPASFKGACKSDCCGGDLSKCSCSSLEAYARACLEAGIILNWRNNQLCSVSCPNNLVHQECGSACQKTCTSVGTTCTDSTCIDGCFCPHGMVLHKGKCIMNDQCPCTKEDGSEFRAGDVIPKDCNSCTCTSGGIWHCTQKKCEATCSATGDPHYMTFDGKRFNFMGVCHYYMMKDDNFNIVAENIKCGHGQASCTKAIAINIPGHTIRLDHNHQLFVDGTEIHKLPYQGNGIKIYMVSSLFMKAELSNGITVLWDGRTRAYITAPSSFFNKTKGLCGTYDSNQKNDFKTLQGDIETDVNEFGNRMRVNPQCAPVTIPARNPCEDNTQRKTQAKQYCDYILQDFFKPCHSKVDATSFHEDCMYDMCACTENLRDCLCPMIGEYAKQCAAMGVQVLWRNHIPECQIPCNGGQVYQVCPNECVRTCSNIAQDQYCVQSKECAEGCGCPANHTLNDEGECIAIAECPCLFSGNEYPAGFLTKMDDKICTCRDSRWECTVIPTIKAVTVTVIGNGTQPPPTVNPFMPVVQDICDAKQFQEYTKCLPECPVTCQNMHDTTTTCPAPTSCTAGCKCMDEYVLEGKQCVKPSACPCYHGGKAYFEGQKIQMDCNECTCRGQNWDCTNKDCPAICSAVGDSHYHTFDGREYEFQGSCDYVLAKSTDQNPHKFLITENNVPCGTSGVTCTKSITFSIGEPGTKNYYSIQLIKGKPISVESESPFNVTEVGESIMVTTNTGITLVWDKGTRVYIKLKTEHKGKVEGLCGNFDADQKNDFTMPQGGPPAIKANKFGDSWKVHDYCGPPNNVTDTCVQTPHRKPWAQRKCGIISSKLFETCHHVVPYQKYLEKCVFDACACDLGGDCECLCTAVAAYAHECAIAGVPVSWRTDAFCPIQCETCQKYNPCISICPKKTCDNRLVYDHLIKDCKEEMCFEGCEIEPCADGMVYDGTQKPMKCIPEPLCNNSVCVFNGRHYRQNEQITDEAVCDQTCEICYCSDNGEMKRNGFCSTTPHPSTVSPAIIPVEIPTPSPTSNGGGQPSQETTMAIKCLRNDWTDWMSASQPTPTNQGDIETISGLRKKYVFCDNYMMTAIQCRVVGTNTMSADSGQKVTCDLKEGLRCLKASQANGQYCNDYEVRFDCNCGLTPGYQTGGKPTPHPHIGKTGSPTPSPPSWSAGQPTPSPTGGTGHQPTPRPTDETGGTPTPQPNSGLTGSPTPGPTYLPGESPTPTKYRQNGDEKSTTPKPNPEETKQPTASPGLHTGGAPTPSPGVNSGIPTLQPTQTTVYFNCKDGWSEWMNVDSPTVKNPFEIIDSGDFELMGELRHHYSFCAKPNSIKCQTVADKLPYTSSKDNQVTCDLIDGLVCSNSKQAGRNCSDYEVSVYCDCGGFKTVTGGYTTTPGQGIPYVPTPSCMWSPWMNSHTKITKSKGEYETISNLRMKYSFCEFPAKIECREIVTKQSYDIVNQKGVSCDVNRGLVCEDINQNNGHCKDYEVRVYCVDACPSTHSPSAGPNGSPTPSPGSENQFSPTAQPTLNPNGSPTASPGIGPNSSPTASPGTGPNGSPTPSPGTGPNSSPTASPGTGPNGSPTPSPGTGPNGSPTPSPGTGPNSSPTASPGTGPNGSPTPSHGTGPNSSATPSPGTGHNGSPTPSPGTGPNGSPTPSHGTGPNSSATPSPGTGPNGSPTPSPGTGPNSSPTPSPGTGPNGSATLSPGTGPNGSPTPSPGTGPNGSPTPSPGTGPHSSATPSPGTGPNGSPTPSPGTGPNGSPTPSPGTGPHSSATPSPGTGPNGSPTPSPGTGPNGSPTPSPGTGPHSSATPSPGTGPNGSPTPSPGTGPYSSPTPSPGTGKNSSPTPSPGTGPKGSPTPSPETGPDSSPTPSPGTGPNSSPTPSPGTGPNGSPTPSPRTDICIEGWTDWINVNHPSGSIGDVELPKDIPGYPKTCDEVIAAQCAVASSGLEYKNTGQNVDCNINGLTCVNDQTQTCQDYKSRFYCLCKKPTPKPTIPPFDKPTPKPTSDLQRLPTLTATPSAGTIVCDHGWTQEMNVDTPDSSNNGDYETIPKLRKKYAFCDAGNIIAARCYKAGTNITHDHTGEVVTCNKTGVFCNNWDQMNQSTGKCSDYSVRFYCNCKYSTAGPTTSMEQPTKVTTKDFSGPTKQTGSEPFIATTAKITGTVTQIPVDHCKTELGIQDGSIYSYEMFKASSSKGSDADAYKARLNGQKAWEARYNDITSEYIQIDLGETMYVAGIRIQGNPNNDMWVTKFSVATSLNGQTWSTIQDAHLGSDVVFSGNSDKNTPVDVMLDGANGDNEIRTHFVRILPKEFYGGISLRFEVLSCRTPPKKTTSIEVTPHTGPTISGTLASSGTGMQIIPTARPLCYEPMGIENSLHVKDSQLTSSSSREKMTNAQYGRLQNAFGSWIPHPNDTKPWILVDMKQPKLISGIMTQGSAKEDKWVTKYKITYSMDGFTFTSYNPQGTPMEFQGNHDRNTIMRHILRQPITARFIKIHPINGGPNGLALRFNLLGCYYYIPGMHHHTTSITGTSSVTIKTGTDTHSGGSVITVSPGVPYHGKPTPSPGASQQGTPTPSPSPFPTLEPLCAIKMGIENFLIVGKPQLTASSSKDSHTGANYGRLNEGEKKPTAWIPSPQDKNPYIEVNFLEPKTVTGVMIQGHGQLPQWVKTFTVFTSTDGKTFKPYSNKENSTTPNIFQGNKNNTQPETYLFNRNIVAQYVKIYPGEYTGAPALRFNLLGCNPSVVITTPEPTLPPGVTTVSPSVPAQIKPTAHPNPDQYIAPPKVCLLTMGVQSSLIVDNKQMTASSSQNTSSPQASRIYASGSWMPSKTDTKPWIQIDFLRPKLLSGVVTQGDGKSQNWVKTYQIYTSIDGINFIPYSDKTGDNTAKTYNGNKDNVTPVRHLFNRNITAQFIRLYPTESYTGTPALRWNVIGCTPDTPRPKAPPQGIPTPKPGTGLQIIPTAQPGSDQQGTPTLGQYTGTGSTAVPSGQLQFTPTPAPLCEIPMGLSNKFIVTDSQLTSSSKLNNFTGAERGRIYTEKDGSFTGGWVPSVSNKKQWIQVDLLAPYEITGIITQGLSEKPNWVTKYAVYYSTDGENFIPVPKSPVDKSPMVFTGNKDQFTPVQHLFPNVVARFVRVYPLEWHNLVGLRFNLLGCQSPLPSNIRTTQGPDQTPSPLSCMYWTPWVNTGTPDKVGEYETVYNLNQLVHSCDKKNMKAIECRDMASKMSHDKIGETGVQCDLTTVGGLLCRNDAQADHQCNDYEIRVFCDECPTVAPTNLQTPTPGVNQQTTPTASPRPCENRTFWSEWINNHKPNSVGESEFMHPKEMTKFCAIGKISKIECATLDGTDYSASGEMVTCTLDEGLNCDASLNAPFPCSDYRVRYECKEVCLATPTPKTTNSSFPITTEKPTPKQGFTVTTMEPTLGTTPTPPQQRCVVSKWSPWINRDKPDIGVSDHEFMTPEELKRFCYGGNVTQVECAVDSENHIPYYSSGEKVGYCNKEHGFLCTNADNFPIPCSDYKIRYYCDCANETGTKSPTPLTTEAPNTSKLTYVRCAWSDWLSSTSPTNAPTSGDMETIENLKKHFGLCPSIIDIECRIRDNGSSTSASQDSVTCDIQNGLRCFNRDQVSFQCHDYEVRVKCWDDSCNKSLSSTSQPQSNKQTSQFNPDTTAVSQFSQSTTPICAPGETLEPCAYKCGDLCDNMAQLIDTCKQSLGTCVPLCRPAKHACVPGEKLMDKITCVQQSMCPCRKQDGTIAKPLEKWNNPNDYCSVCHCFNNTVTCTKDETCSTPSPTPYKPIPVTHPQCFWTHWINMDTPLTSEGDIETISKIRTLHTFCYNPVHIECREVKSHTDYTTRGQTVTCDVNTGLKCLNYENGGNCDDYEVRFYCPCATTPTTTTTTTLAPPSGVQLIPTAAPTCGWTHWINLDNPTIMKEGKLFEGDIESIANIRKMHPLCEYYMMTQVECREAKTKIPSSQTDEVVSCDRIRGLRCKNDAQPDGKCLDYEVRVFCNCFGIPGFHHYTSPPLTSPSKTTKPIPNVCGWTTWLNGHKPDTQGETETFTNLRKDFRFCDIEDITSIECRQHGSEKSFMETGQKGVICDIHKGGLMCNNADQISTGGKCFDYEIRILCEPKELDCSHLTTASPSSGHYINPTPSPRTDIFGNPILHTTEASVTDIPTTSIRHTTDKLKTSSLDKTTRVPVSNKHTTSIDTTTVTSMLVCTDGMTQGSSLPMNNDRMSSSSSLNPNSGVERSHLTDTNSGLLTGGWVAGKNEKTEWIMINFGRPMIIDSITTKGQAGQPYWISAFKLLYSMDKKTYTYYEENGQPKVFSANYNSETPVHQRFTAPINAQYVKLLPVSWNGAIALRWQLFGCTGAPVTTPLAGKTLSPNPEKTGVPTPAPTDDSGLNPTPSPSGNSDLNPTPSPSGNTGLNPTPSPTGNTGLNPTPSPSGNTGLNPTPSPSGNTGLNPTPSPTGDSGLNPTASPSGNTGLNPTPSPTGDSSLNPTPSPSGNIGLNPTPSPSGNTGLNPTPSPSGITGLNPTPSPSGNTGLNPTPSPSTCNRGWSNWINRDTPDTGDGDHEAMTAAEKLKFCPGGEVIDVECATKDGMPYSGTSEIATCYPDTGFTCNTMDNFNVPCMDYKIRYMCKCAELPTKSTGNDGHKPTVSPSPEVHLSPTPSPNGLNQGTPTPSPTGDSAHSPTPKPRVCITRWSSWLNRDKPDTNNGDYEKMTPEEIRKFCPGGTIKQVECQTSTGIPFHSTGAIQSCTKEQGMICNNADNFPVGCDDYQIKYFCMCGENPTPSPTAPGQGTPMLTPTVVSVTPTNEIPDSCKVPMGMQNEAIRREMITASSQRSSSSSPEHARLNGPNSWIAGVDNKNQYIQVDFLQPTFVTGVTTEGRPSVPSYVSSYFVLFSNDGVNWNTYMENGQKKQFSGNFDSVTPVTHFFTAPIKARYIRINPQTFYGKIAMRFELHGCFTPYPTTIVLTPPPTSVPTTMKTPPKLPATINVEKCTQWDNWVNMHTPDASGDSEPIAEVKKHSQICTNPMKIECRTATGSTADDLGQIISCNLWSGLQCDNMNQIEQNGCADYKVRLACLKQTTECIPPKISTVPSSLHKYTKVATVTQSKRVAKCYEDMTTINCPISCPEGQFCDGLHCVQKSECTCKIEGKIVRPGGITQGRQCATCQCINGENKCMPKSCPPCQPAETKYVNVTSCECTCKTCADNEYRCGNTRCIPKASRCDGIIDCDTDEVNCVVVPQFTPPGIPTPSPTTGKGGKPEVSLVANTGLTPTPSPTPVDNNTPCVDGSWSPWVDEKNPTTYALGDKEKSALEYQKASRFCSGGTIHKVECWSTDIGAFHYSTGEVMKCTPTDGVICNNADNFPLPCTNYKIRYQCTCIHNTPQLDTDKIPSTAATTVPTGPMNPDTLQNHTRPHKDQTTTVSGSACRSGWSPYINENHPDTYALGDKEKSALEYQKATHFCAYGKISTVECWDVDIDAAHYSSGEVMTCTPEGGVVCNNADNFPAPCSDYKIRYFCECVPSAVTTASPQPVSTATTPAPCNLSKCQPMVKPLLKEGEELMVVKTTDGCCDKYTVVCKPEKCITRPPTCTSPRIVQQTNAGECCPQYNCECPNTCPKMVTPVCKPDSHYTVIDTECNCQAYACVKNIINGTMPPVVTVNQVCKYAMNGHEVVKHPGDIWQDGHCKSCQCMNRTDGTVETSCRTQTCPSCKLGEVHVDLPGECCGQCKPSGCVVSGTVYKDGQHMPIDKKCYTRTCTYMPDFQQYALQDTFIRCPTTDLPACSGNKTSYDSTGCCQTCKVTIKQNASQCSTCMPRLMFRETSRSVGFFTVTNSIGITCKNTDPVQDLMECSGYCSSHAQYTAIMQGFNNKCNCCQPTTTSDKTVKLTCTDGTTMNKTYKVPDTCGCQACSAGR
ncbi:mucin-5AC-like [Mytilus californianus]|uniref:mucin-5AC-like n=1 Tax=Mytilus californianus TaxID=6549 RepID=UPI00224683D7|nr:mucin-5AC-like [Mytilus californianus]